MPSQLAYSDVKGGMNAADPPNMIATNQVARMVNCRLENGLPTTRYGTRVVPLSGDAMEFFRSENIQGSTFYNPAKGQGGLILSDRNASIIVSVGGRKFVASIEGRRSRSTAEITEITNGLVSSSDLHLVWLSVWENLLVAQDGMANAFIWDGASDAYASQGYDTIDKETSQIPNGGTVMAYVHGRGVVVVNSRFVLVSDSLHKDDFTTSRNLVNFQDQVYWATGQYFVPPSAMGGVNAAAVLPLKNTQHGHGDLMLHCEDGIFSIDLNVYPRSAWSSTPMVKHALLAAGACGPYAVAIVDGDQFYRSRMGLQSLRSAAGNSQLEGNPEQTISNAVSTWLNGDYARWLRFSSVELWGISKRLYLTTGHIVQGRFRWSRGAVVRNMDPSMSQSSTPAAWEGLLTLPPETCGIVQFVSGLFDGDERMFAWTRGVDGKNRLVEFTDSLNEDVLADGTTRPIRAAMMTRAIDAGAWWETREYTTGKLFLKDIRGQLDFGVWFRPAETETWIHWRSGSVTVPDEIEAGEDLGDSSARSIPIGLGKLPSVCVPDGAKSDITRSIQILIRWQGVATIEGFKLSHGAKNQSSDDSECRNTVFHRAPESEYDDFEYSQTDKALWL